MMGELEKKVAIVTGGARGLGCAMVEAFAAEGARVVIADRDVESGEALRDRIGDTALLHQTDVADPSSLQALIEASVAHFGRLDIMVNNAAISSAMHPRFLDETFADFDAVLRVNLLGVALGTQYAARQMAGNGGGSIINITATSGLTAGFGVISYRMAKTGVVQLTRSTAIDLAEYGIRVNGIAPGNIATSMNAFTPDGVESEAAADWAAALDRVRFANQPLKRKGRPEDVAQAALYLAGERSAQVTGIIIPVDGGVTAGDPVNHLAAILNARATFPGV